jgi:hypothetical protein
MLRRFGSTQTIHREYLSPFGMSTILNGFAAYPSSLREVRETLSRLPQVLQERRIPIDLRTWENNDIAGYCLVDPILESIAAADFLIADITLLNFNVIYEIAYAMAKNKRVVLLQNKAIRSQSDLMRELGLFDTIGWKHYANADDLCNYLSALPSIRPLRIPERKKANPRPFFVVWPSERTESEIRLLSRIKKQARLGFQQFDPQEDGRLPVSRALDDVVNTYGVILPLISANRNDAVVHNFRCAFVAGLSHGLERETLILQAGSEPVPLDLRDAVSFYSHPESIDRLLADFAPRVFEKTLQHAQTEFPALVTPIQKLQIGASAAENEHDDLGSYYIQTEEFQRVVRGEIQVVTGRKGSGKTALFYQVRNKIRNDRRNVVLDLNPEGFQLRKFKSLVLERLEAGTHEHTITAFWEYLLFLELCYKLLEKDQQIHLHNHVLRPKYLVLQELYRSDSFVSEGDFAERLLRLLEIIEERFQTQDSGRRNAMLTRAELTAFLYQHDIERLRSAIIDYLEHKGAVWVLFDNIDKGWSAHGVDESDLVNLRCLIEALRKLTRDFRKSEIECHGVVFIRNDVYEILIEGTPDRGKLNRVSLDWSDTDLLREMLRRRFLYSLGLSPNDQLNFDTLWHNFSVSHLMDGSEASEYLVSRCLMRPRSLLDFLYFCKSHAVNVGHNKIEDADIKKGEESYSTELVNGISLEIQDILPCAQHSLFAFVECDSIIDRNELIERMARIVHTLEDREKLFDLLLWYGFIGVVRGNLEETFIYSVNYDARKLKAIIDNLPQHDRIFVINAAFHKGLEIKART